MDLQKNQKVNQRRRLNDMTTEGLGPSSQMSKTKDRFLKKSDRFYKKKWFKISSGVAVSLLILLLILGGVSVGPAQAAYGSAIAGRESVMKIQASIAAQDFEAAKMNLSEAKGHFMDVKEDLSSLGWAQFVPGASRQYNAVRDMVDGTLLALEAGETGLGAAEQIIDPVLGKDAAGSFNDFSSEEKGEILSQISTVQPGLEKTLELLMASENKFEKIPDFAVLPQIAEARDLVNGQLPEIVEIVSEGVAFSKFLPTLAGYPEEQTYLFLFQNNTELRPSGGFLGSYGEVKINNAEILSFITKDVYSLDEASDIEIEPPWQIKKLAAPYNKSWYMRDSNWSPDFEIASDTVRDFYKKEGGLETFDGVIGITPDFVGDLLDIVGPTQIPGLPYTFTKENFTETVEFHVEKNFVNNGIDFHQRKDILSDLSQILIGKMLVLPKDQWPHVYEVIQRSLNEKHIVMHFDDAFAQDFVMEKKWGGRVLDAEGDYIMVVDSNMASLKTDEFIERDFSYVLDATGDVPKANLKLHYRNAAPGFTWKTTRYRNFNRIYVSPEARFLSVAGNEVGSEYYLDPNTPYEVKSELGKMSFGTFVSIEPQEERSIEYSYELPKSVVSGDEYTLYVQKQIGTIKPVFKARLVFDRKVKSVGPEEYVRKISDTEVEIESNLLVDREFKIIFE